MPGSYAHLTAINRITDYKKELPEEVKDIYDEYIHFCELGCLGPDYPYLKFLSKQAKTWADWMHRELTISLVRRFVQHLSTLDGPARGKCAAWVLGYFSHMVLDTTIHPLLPDYDQDPDQHRIWELNQDVFIYKELNLGDIGTSEHLKSVFNLCSPGGNIDPEIKALWQSALLDNYPKHDGGPNIDEWHNTFFTVIDSIEEGRKLVPFARHFAEKVGLIYPQQWDRKYIDALESPAPGQTTIDYAGLFEQAIINVVTIWKQYGEAIVKGTPDALLALSDWNLDKGTDNSGQMIWWRA